MMMMIIYLELAPVLNIDAKVYVMLLLRRLRVDMEERMHDAQHGFRSGRGTVDCLFNLRRVVELARAHAAPACCL